MTAWVDGRLVVVVADVGGGFATAPGSGTPTPPRRWDDGGAGSGIIRQLTDLVSIRTGDDGTQVRMELSSEPAHRGLRGGDGQGLVAPHECWET